jgi:hypothetical protein
MHENVSHADHLRPRKIRSHVTACFCYAGRGLAYLLLVGLGGLGVLLWPFQAPLEDLRGLLPDRGPGWWVALAGVVVIARAAYQIVREPATR